MGLGGTIPPKLLSDTNTPPLTYQGTERLSGIGKVGIKKLVAILTGVIHEGELCSRGLYPNQIQNVKHFFKTHLPRQPLSPWIW